MKKIIGFLSLLALTMGVACKKEKVEDVAPPVDNGTTYVIDSNNTSGYLMVSDTVWVQGSVLVPADTMVKAEFFDINDSHNRVLVNAVSVNATPVPYNTLHLDYESSLPGQTIIPASWDIKGNQIIPDFTYSNLKSMPEYSKYDLLPSVIDRSKDLVFSLSGFKNTRYALVCIFDHYPFTAYGIILGSPVGDSKSLTFPSQSLSNLKPNPGSTIEIRIENINYQAFGNRTFAFINEIVLIKKIILK